MSGNADVEVKPDKKIEKTTVGDENVKGDTPTSTSTSIPAPTQAPTPEEQFVLPGDIVGTTEEYKPGDGTYTVRSDIHSILTGNAVVDQKRRTISVRPETGVPPVVSKGDIVIGNVINVRESIALVEINTIKGYGERAILNPGIAAIHISNVMDDYVKDLSQQFAPQDVVKAKVIDMSNMRLTTAGKELGVMTADCPRCGVSMVVEKDKLKCPECGRTENRKISSDYGTGII
ncbi:MAG: exosome complex RNA-binding protein Csl4 [Euryarchaeota archaeon]|nr:exosome complex RNA-binding protein Csl4 [Euryarchaeota archaeon]